MFSVKRSFVRVASTSHRNTSSFLAALTQATEAIPNREAVRYKAKNMKWTAARMMSFVDSHANALLDLGFSKDDTTTIWMAESSEKHVTLLAAAKMGMKVVDVDPTITDINDIRAFLRQSACQHIFFHPVTETHDNMLLLRKAIPELFEYDDTYGQLFHSKHFPKLKKFIQTGFEQEVGMLNYKNMFLPDPVTKFAEIAAAATTDDTPAYCAVTKKPDGNGIVMGPTISHKDLAKQPAFQFAKNLIQQKYFEC